MANEDLHGTRGWVNVDRSGDTAGLVDVLAERGQSPVWASFRKLWIKQLELSDGCRLLDVGCGIGNETRAFANEVGSAGTVMGIDSSEAMIAEARQRSEGMEFPIQFAVGDIYGLDFEDAAFDRCFASQLFIHLDDPLGALRELSRVTRPGGRIAIAEADRGTWVIDHPNRSLTRKILDFASDGFRNPWIGRQLRGLFFEAGLVDLSVTPFNFVGTDDSGPLGRATRRAAGQAQEAGVITSGEAAEWLRVLDRRVEQGRYFVGITNFAVTGRKP